MKYTLDLLPLRAFQGRRTPVGGRGLRLHGGSDMGNQFYETDNSRQAAADAAYEAYHAPAPEPAWSPPPESAPSEPAWSPPPESAPVVSDIGYAPAPANQWQQTVNDIYQQEFGRQADPSGMASFTAALNAGMTGEQMRAALASSAEGQSYGLSPVAPLTAAAQAPQWEYQPESYDDFTGAYFAPYYLDVNSGERKELGQPVQATGVTPVDPNTLAQHVGPNFEGTPTQFYDEQGNLKGVLVDAVRAGLNTREGELILDPMSLGLALKPNETASLDSKIQQRNEQGQLLFIDPLTGNTTIYNTGVPAETGSTVKDLLYINERKYGGQIPADTVQGALLLAATMATGGVGGALMNAAGLGGAAAGGLTATEAAALMGGTLSEAGAAATMGGQLASQGINWGAAATAAARTAAINAAVTAAQGGNVGDVLKAGALGAVTGGAGVAGADFLGGGALAQIGTQTAIATAIAAARGQDPLQAALSGAITATLSNVIPAGTADVLNGAGITDPSIQKAINSAISSSVVAAIRGGDVGTAAIMGAVNSALTSVAGMIGNSQIVQDIKANITNALTSTIDSVKYELGATNAQALPVEGSNRSPVGTVLDTQAPYDADAELDRVIQNLPSSASGVEYTPATPPLISQATGQSDAELMAQALANFQNNPSVGASLGTLAGATTSDVNPVTVPSNDGLTVNMSGSNKIGDLLDSYNTGIATLGYAPVEIDDEDFLDYARKAIEEEGATSSAPESTTSAGALPVSSGTGDFLGAFEDLAPAKVYGSAVPQVNAQGNVIGAQNSQLTAENTGGLLNYLANFPTEIKNQALGLFEAGMNQLGFVAGNVAAAGYGVGKTWYDLATGAPVDPKTIDAVANNIAERLSYTPVTQEGQNIAQALGDLPAALTGSSRGLPPVTSLAALPPVGQIGTGLKLYGEQIAPTFSSLESINNFTNKFYGFELAPNGVMNVIEPSKTFDFLGKTENSTSAAGKGLVSSLLNDANGGIFQKTAGATLIDDLLAVGKKTDGSIVQQMLNDLKAGDSIPDLLKSQVKTSISELYSSVALDTPSIKTLNFLQGLVKDGASLKDVGTAVVFASQNAGGGGGSGNGVTIEQSLQDVSKATNKLDKTERLPAAFAFLLNSTKLGTTPSEAIANDWVTKEGALTEAGAEHVAEVQPAVQEQPAAEPQPVTNLQPSPLTNPALTTETQPVLQEPIKTVKITEPPIGGGNIGGGGTSTTTPPLSVNPPIVNPPIDVAPPININPPIPTPPPLVQAAITPPKASAPGAAMTPSYMYAGAQGSGPGALPGNLQSTFLQGVNVNEYNPFENYNVYQQLGSPAPVRAAEGGSPLQLAQMQQGVSGVDPRLYSMLQKRQTPNYFTYGQDASGGNPTTFAGSQLMGKPTPGIPVIPTGQKAGSDWLYQGSGTNPLAMAGTGIANLPTGMMAEGGQAHGGEDEHIPEFITGATGHYVRGRGDGQSDDIPAMLADGEYVFDASTVSTLGNGSSDAGAKLLDAFRESLRDHTRSAPADKIPPKASPLEYMKEALQNVGRK